MRRLAPFLLAAAALALPLQAAGGAPPLKHARAASGGIAVDLSYRAGKYSDSDLRISIRRAGKLVLSAPVARFACHDCQPAGMNPDVFGRPLTIRNLDGDSEPEVLLDLYTGGAHCCFYTVFFRWTDSAYSARTKLWGDPGYELKDLDRTGRPEFVSADDRFAYEFTDYADSALPVQIWRYDHGSLRDVTASYPSALRSEAAGLWSDYLAARKTRDDSRGLLAAWLADEVRLGRGPAAWKQLEAIERRGELTAPKERAYPWLTDAKFWPDGSAYLAKLRRFLGSTGYTKTA
jgi:hypothetical protein